MLDTLQILFWSVAYVLIIIAGTRSRKIQKVSMPYIPGVVIVAWEICALYNSGGFWGHILWLSLDLGIVYFGFRYAKNLRGRLAYGTAILVTTTVLMYIFTIPDGSLISSFILDLLIAVFYLVDRKKLSPELKVPIAVTKMIGDTFAGLYYAPQSGLVAVIAIAVFVCNLCYLNQCIDEKKQ